MEINYAQQPNLDQDAHGKQISQMSNSEIRSLAKNLVSLAGTKFSAEEKKSDSSSQEPLGAIERAMRRHPGLTREKAQAMFDEFGG